MKTYEQLTGTQQGEAVSLALNNLLADITNGIRFNDKLNEDDLQARIDTAGEKAEKLQTPWFWAEIIMEDEYCADMLKRMAQCNAEDAIYSEQGEHCVSGIAT